QSQRCPARGEIADDRRMRVRVPRFHQPGTIFSLGRSQEAPRLLYRRVVARRAGRAEGVQGLPRGQGVGWPSLLLPPTTICFLLGAKQLHGSTGLLSVA